MLKYSLIFNDERKVVMDFDMAFKYQLYVFTWYLFYICNNRYTIFAFPEKSY